MAGFTLVPSSPSQPRESRRYWPNQGGSLVDTRRPSSLISCLSLLSPSSFILNAPLPSWRSFDGSTDKESGCPLSSPRRATASEAPAARPTSEPRLSWVRVALARRASTTKAHGVRSDPAVHWRSTLRGIVIVVEQTSHQPNHLPWTTLARIHSPHSATLSFHTHNDVLTPAPDGRPLLLGDVASGHPFC